MIELLSVMSLAGIGAFLFFPYNRFRTDKVRHKLFSLRDDLFDKAVRGDIAFDSPAYQATRSLLNGAIRYSHRISFSRIIAHKLLNTVAFNPVRDGLGQAMNSSSAADRELCAQYIRKADIIVFEHVFSSPLVLMFVLPQIIALVLSKVGFDLAGRAVSMCRTQFAEFNKLAFREGQLH